MIATACFFLGACATSLPSVSIADLKQQVTATERAFAKSMSDRDYAAFTSFISTDTVFFSGSQATTGKDQVAILWKQYFAKPDAPFSWEPDQVEVLPSGNLAMSSGPVRDVHGKKIATFTSVWRLEAPGIWRIVFDKGNPVCDCAGP